MGSSAPNLPYRGKRCSGSLPPAILAKTFWQRVDFKAPEPGVRIMRYELTD